MVVPGPGRGPGPDWRFAFVPARLAVIEDSWDAMGLRGTGSHHLSLSGVSVPAEQLAAPFFEPARHDGPLWRIPLVTLATMFLAAVPLGVAGRALDEFAAIAIAKRRGQATQPIGHDPDTQCQLARAATEAVGRVFRLAGAEAVYAHHPLQRCIRDVHAAGQHILFSAGRDQAYAKVRLGIDQPTFMI